MTFSILFALWSTIGLTLTYFHLRDEDLTVGYVFLYLSSILYGPFVLLFTNPDTVLIKRKNTKRGNDS